MPPSGAATSTTSASQHGQHQNVLVYLLHWAQCTAELIYFALLLLWEAVSYALPPPEQRRQYVTTAQRWLREGGKMIWAAGKSVGRKIVGYAKEKKEVRIKKKKE